LAEGDLLEREHVLVGEQNLRHGCLAHNRRRFDSHADRLLPAPRAADHSVCGRRGRYVLLLGDADLAQPPGPSRTRQAEELAVRDNVDHLHLLRGPVGLHALQLPRRL
ncbi:MAG: hypothetical protein AVDCRST_MAG80-2379, partial [uncultured Rubrobacteraceae bacterium]